MSVRIPAIIREVQALNPDYPPEIQKALDAAHDELVNDAPIPMLALPAPDYDEWASDCLAHRHTWLNTDWFFAEMFWYRYLIQLVRWWESGRDPFAPKKAQEIEGAALWSFLDRALTLVDAPLEDRLPVMLQYALWGNRVDLSYMVGGAHGQTGSGDDLLVDDTLAAVAHLLRRQGDIHLVTDNVGTELAIDLALVDTLLDGVAPRVIMHLKMHPTYVSDATLPDVLGFLKLLESGTHGQATFDLATRLRGALSAGRLRLAPDLFWNSSRMLWEMPRRLALVIQNAALVILKGDANYRRMTGDAILPADTPFAAATSYLPVPLLALRTLKSDTIVGLPPGVAAHLDSLDKDWRINGRRGLLQFRQ
jgi:uncharacterized protein with ATP-grasp and redox domains